MKKVQEKLIEIASKALQDEEVKLVTGEKMIPDGYNGAVAAFGVAIALSGLRPAVAMYYSPKSENEKVNKVEILNAVAVMLILLGKMERGPKGTLAKQFLTYLLKNGLDQGKLKKQVIDCVIALKHVIRTYPVKKENYETK